MNSFNIRKWFRSVSIVLTVAILLFSINTIVESSNNSIPRNHIITAGELSTNIEESSEKSSDSMTSTSLKIEDCPEAVSIAEIEKGGHVQRLKTQEKDLNTIVFQNDDGSKTMYYYSEPVKYIDEQGNVRDKSNNLTEVSDNTHKEYKYVNSDNNVCTFFPNSLNSETGVRLESGDIKIELKPIVSRNNSNKAMKTQSASDKGNQKASVVYDSVFGRDTKVQYSPLFNGFKEDIILASYSETNEFAFSLTTNGLSMAEKDGLYYLSDPKSGKAVINIGDLLVYDNSGKSVQIPSTKVHYDHHYNVDTIVPNNEYRITVVVDDNFLKSSDTVYPVTIDPSFDVVSSNDAIMDICVNQSGTITKGNYLIVGESDFDQSVSRAFVKFPGLLESWQWAALAPPGTGNDTYPQITDLSLWLYNYGVGLATAPIKTYQYYGDNAVNWSYTANGTTPTSFSSANFNAKGLFASSTPVDIDNGWYEFSLTDISAYNLSKGVVIQNQYESLNSGSVIKYFHSTRNTNKPKITVTWQELNHTSFQTAKTANINTTYYAPVLAPNVKYYFAFTPSATGFYTIKSNNIISGDPYGWLYNSSQEQLAKDDDSGGNRNFRMVYHLDAGKTYYIVVGCYNTGIGKYAFQITPNTDLTQVQYNATITTSITKTATIGASRGRQYFKFIAPSAGTYVFESSQNGNSDPYGWLYNSSAGLISNNDDAVPGEHNFRLTCDLAAGQTVCLVAGCYSEGIGTYTVSVKHMKTITISQELNQGDYFSIPVAVNNYNSLNAVIFSVKFNATDFELVSACEFSPTPILSTGSVANTYVNITSVSSSGVSFSNTSNTPTRPGIVNIIRLKAKQTETLSVTCIGEWP